MKSALQNPIQAKLSTIEPIYGVLIRVAMPITNATEISFIIDVFSRADFVLPTDGAATALPRCDRQYVTKVSMAAVD